MTREVDRRITDLRNAMRDIARSAFAAGWDAADSSYGRRSTVDDLRTRQKAAEKYATDLIPERAGVPSDV